MIRTELLDESVPIEQRLELAIELIEIMEKQIKRLSNTVSKSSWESEVDRQGGSFTAEELDPNRGWK